MIPKLKLMDRELFMQVLESWHEFLDHYENCKIPGIIPQSKHATWVAVPKEYVKDEWWEQQKKCDS
jgi:hypothetical protein